MKKVAVLTLCNTLSFGASLQSVALCKALEDLGCEAFLINYQNVKVSEDTKRRSHESKRNIIEFLKYLTVVADLKDQKRRFYEFENRVKKRPLNVITTTEQLKNFTKDFDIIMCGSDQVWNSNITGGDPNFYLAFCSGDVIKASYASSFGYSSIDDLKEKEIVAQHLNRFNFISVREQSGKEILSELIKKPVQVVLDPTLLLTKKQWKDISNRSYGNREDYILFYGLKHSDTMRRFTNYLSKETGLRILSIGGRLYEKYKKNFKAIRGIGPSEWLSLFLNAKYIVTNSFHGVAFSINLNKSFFVEFLNNSRTNTRLEHILDTFGLRTRYIGEDTNINNSIDWHNVNTILNNKRKESLNYLRNVIGA